MARHEYLQASDEELLAQCDVDRFRGSGPGGQKRNKTESAVRLRHRPSGLSAQATESRSQHENRDTALARLRVCLALELREPVALDDYVAGDDILWLLRARVGEKTRRSVRYPAAVARFFDLFIAHDCSVGDTAASLGVSTGALSRFILGDDVIAKKVGALRNERGMRPLR